MSIDDNFSFNVISTNAHYVFAPENVLYVPVQ